MNFPQDYVRTKSTRNLLSETECWEPDADHTEEPKVTPVRCRVVRKKAGDKTKSKQKFFDRFYSFIPFILNILWPRKRGATVAIICLRWLWRSLSIHIILILPFIISALFRYFIEHVVGRMIDLTCAFCKGLISGVCDEVAGLL